MKKPAPPVAGRQSPMVPTPMWSSASSKPGYVARQQTATGDHRFRFQEPAIMAAPRPQARPQQMIAKPATPRGLDLSSGQQQRRVTVPAPMTTQQQAPKRPAPPIAEPPHTKRMRAAALAPASTRPAVNPASVLSWEPAKRQSWCPPQQPNFLSAPPPQRQATKDKEADLGSMADGQSTIQQGGHKRPIQQKACNDYTDEVLPEKTEDGKIIQKDGNEEDEQEEGDGEFARFLDDVLEIAPEETVGADGKAIEEDGDEEEDMSTLW